MSYKSRKPTLNQRTIASFFGSKHSQQPTPSKSPLHTPERLNDQLNRLTKLTQPRSAFDEFGSSDTSFGSPEVTNFRNPLLVRMSRGLGLPEQRKSDTLFVTDVSDEELDKIPSKSKLTLSAEKVSFEKPMMKRGSSILDILDGKPKKLKRQNTTSLLAAPVAPVIKSLVTLSDEQRAIVHTIVVKGENLFFTGSAGTGKSVVLRQLVQELQRKHGPFAVGVTASTGLAACNIKGQTLHKFLSIGLGTGSPQDLAMKIKRNGIAKKKWKTLQVLVIDEVLMIDGKLFTKIDQIAQILRENQKPFGGIQIVCSGDFYQLPPVSHDNTSQFCFQSPAWTRAIRHTIVLTKVFRQRGDTVLIDMLNALREGALEPEMVSMFQRLLRRVNYSDGIGPTELFPTRQEVKRANESRLLRLPGKIRVYIANDSDRNPQLKRLYENLMCEERLELRVGAQVMYLKNSVDTNIVNGTIGTVVSFVSEDLYVKIFSQFQALDFINISPAFLAIFRLLSELIGCREFSSEQKEQFEILPDQWKPKVAKLAMDAFATSTSSELLPVVNFKTGVDFTLALVRREEFSVDQGRISNMPGIQMGDSLTREQLPLLLAWAMSIHKAQGQSIDRLRVDLRRTFEKGQIYVALSRATSKEHLEVFNFDHRKVSISNEVREFYRTLTTADAYKP